MTLLIFMGRPLARAVPAPKTEPRAVHWKWAHAANDTAASAATASSCIVACTTSKCPRNLRACSHRERNAGALRGPLRVPASISWFKSIEGRVGASEFVRTTPNSSSTSSAISQTW